jgi:hypothetical protein
MKRSETRLDLELRPEWGELDRVREGIAAFLRTQGLDKDAVDALAMVGCELSENAIKYGSYKRGGGVRVSVRYRHNSVLIEVQNPIEAGASRNLAVMDRMIQWIRGRQDPFEAYLARLQEVSMQSLHDKESRLGLVRIAYEGQSTLDFYVNDDNTLAVSALYQI